ncbi:MAG: M20/M25/M40 family metallo-hydrolase [Pseudonocardiaceae bacterium]
MDPNVDTSANDSLCQEGDPLSSLCRKVEGLKSTLQRQLEELVKHASVNIPPTNSPPVQATCNAVVTLLKTAGIKDAQALPLTDNPEDASIVYGSYPGSGVARAGVPTVLLYAHYDVQPAGGGWTVIKDAFDPEVVDGRLYGRGAADDKSGIIMHLGAVQAFDGTPPVNLKIVIEGEEESGKGSLEAYVQKNADKFKADVIVVADAGNWKVGEPTLTTMLRGFVVLDVTVSTLNLPVHSGLYGGVAPDAFIALIRMLASLHDERGNVVVKGLVSDCYSGKEMTEEQYRVDAGVLDGVYPVGLIGCGGVRERLSAKPSITVIGINGVPEIDKAANVLLPTVTARISVRLAPSQNPEDALCYLKAHLDRVKPWDVRLEMNKIATGEGFTAGLEGGHYPTVKRALSEAFDKKPVVSIGQGGSIPLVNVLHKVNPGAAVLLVGCEEPKARIHAPNESVDLEELTRMTLAEAYLLSYLSKSESPVGVERDSQDYESDQHVTGSCFI